jgi:hypothetical protein
MKDYINEFIYCEGLHKVIVNTDETMNSIQKSWWFSVQPFSLFNTDPTSFYFQTDENKFELVDCQKGFQESLNYINEIFKLKGPFDLVLGFSQGI